MKTGETVNQADEIELPAAVPAAELEGNTARAAAYLDKGGVGKSTTTGHLAVALVEQGLDVVAIDLAGKQGDLAKIFGVEEDVATDVENDDDWPNVATTFDESWNQIASQIGEVEVLDLLTYDTDEGVDLIPAHPSLDGLDSELKQIEDLDERYTRFESFVDEFLAPHYDVVLADLPGAPNAVTYNGLWAMRNVIAPAKAGPLEASQLGSLRDDLIKIRADHDVDVALSLVVPNMVEEQTNLAEKYREQYRDEYGAALAPASVPDSQGVPNAADEGRTLFAHESTLATAERAVEAYRAIAADFLKRLDLGGDQQ
jgi:chromosome partitioning protein